MAGGKEERLSKKSGVYEVGGDELVEFWQDTGHPYFMGSHISLTIGQVVTLSSKYPVRIIRSAMEDEVYTSYVPRLGDNWVVHKTPDNIFEYYYQVETD